MLVNIGGTSEGLGAVYALARQQGFATLGIVSTLARARAQRRGAPPPVDFRGTAHPALSPG